MLKFSLLHDLSNPDLLGMVHNAVGHLTVMIMDFLFNVSKL